MAADRIWAADIAGPSVARRVVRSASPSIESVNEPDIASPITASQSTEQGSVLAGEHLLVPDRLGAC